MTFKIGDHVWARAALPSWHDGRKGKIVYILENVMYPYYVAWDDSPYLQETLANRLQYASPMMEAELELIERKEEPSTRNGLTTLVIVLNQ